MQNSNIAIKMPTSAKKGKNTKKVPKSANSAKQCQQVFKQKNCDDFIVLVLLSAHIVRFSLSPLWDFF